ncbi:FGFR1 oncogene partner 2 like [Pseudolycoriella hygida]|uniref:FGFR1 oncogene partner 2 like n=1 Tax=Pseudolycoriella hygida TaxID=35572 RepID=A0A9Q0MQB3_9DIPT|nr:FGFR1 oncogene partner 2 like [Pseudolycoriella hygida]
MVDSLFDRKMTASIDKLVDDAKKMALRLRDRIVLGDSLVSQSEAINENLVTLKLLQNEFDALNKLARKTTNQQLVKTINNEYPHIREIQMENRELRACLNDHQRALEHIMTKFRQHTQHSVLNSKFDFPIEEMKLQKQQKLNSGENEKILEMAAVMQKAASLNEEKENEQIELIDRLMAENMNLRQLLQIPEKEENIKDN